MDDSYVTFVVDQLHGLGDVRARAMFGAHGLYVGDTFFAIVHEGRLFFKTDEQSKQSYIDAGMKSFEPKPGVGLWTYYEVPVDVLEDDTALADWARGAVDVATANPPRPRRKHKR